MRRCQGSGTSWTSCLGQPTQRARRSVRQRSGQRQQLLTKLLWVRSCTGPVQEAEADRQNIAVRSGTDTDLQSLGVSVAAIHTVRMVPKRSVEWRNSKLASEHLSESERDAQLDCQTRCVTASQIRTAQLVLSPCACLRGAPYCGRVGSLFAQALAEQADSARLSNCVSRWMHERLGWVLDFLTNELVL